MSPAAVSFLAKIPPEAKQAVLTALRRSRVRHPDPETDEPGRIHFLSIVAFPPDPLNRDEDSWLSIETTFDGRAEEAADFLAGHLHAHLCHIVAAMGAEAGSKAALSKWLEAHRLRFRIGLDSPQGVAFDGTPGMPVSRIRFEARLADKVRVLLNPVPTGTSALDRLRQVRDSIFADPAYKDALFSEPTQLLERDRSARSIALPVLQAAARDYLWFLLLLPLLVVLLAVVFGRHWPLLEAMGLGPAQLPAMLWSAAAALLAMIFVERVRFGQWSPLWLLAAALAAAVWTLPPSLAQAVSVTPEVGETLPRLAALLGLAFGVFGVLRSPLRVKARWMALFVLVVMASAAAEQAWTRVLAPMPRMVVVTLALVGSTFLTLLLLAAWLRVASTRLQTGVRAAVVAGMAMLGAHLILEPEDAPWVALLALAVLAIESMLLAATVAIGYGRLREDEEGHRPVDREPEKSAMEAILEHENQHLVVQNHLAAQSIVKPGWHRIVLLGLALWLISQVTAMRSPAGFLGRIGTIHHARWLLVPGTRRLLFLSNYDGSWQSYLEDFIARLRQGLSSIWSNTEGFPRTFRLTSGGAADGSGFKRWARRQQVPSQVWMSGYPDLTTAAIRKNATIRSGLAGATTERDAQRWLSALGLAIPEELARDKIPSLVFGGMKQFPHSALIAVRFLDADAACRLLSDLATDISYGPPASDRERALTVGLSYKGLSMLSGKDALPAMLPMAFVQGMADPDRARMLGDFDLPEAVVGPDDDRGVSMSMQPPFRRWGKSQDLDPGEDAVLVLYTKCPQALTDWLDDIRRRLGQPPVGSENSSFVVVHEQRMLPTRWCGSGTPREHASSVANVLDAKDGISQPIIRGLEDSVKPQSAIHVVEPGEIVLGYRDNLRQMVALPPGGGTNDLANGSFLVVRQLQFDRQGFDRFLAEEARRLLPRSASDLQQREQQKLLAAKMLGRWPSGASLVREPYSDQPGAYVENDFLYGREDPSGLRCPLGSHVRRMNPRDSLDPGSKTQLAVSNRHRIFRVGRRYRSSDQATGATEGLMFMCLNADIERQFEFLQQTWALGSGFHGLDGEVDPLVGPGGLGQGFSIPGESGPTHLARLPRFVRLVGGGYFLLPGRDYFQKLCARTGQP